MKPLSIQLYTVREQAKKDFPGVIRQIGEIGYKGVEFAGLHGCDPREIRRLIDDLGMKASSTHAALPTKETINEAVDLAGVLGYDILISGKGPGEFKTLDDVKAAAAQYQAATELLAGHGLRMAYHNHWWEMARFGGALGLETLLELAPGLVAELDIYWAANFGAVDVPALIGRRAARIPLLHVKDGPLVKDEPHTASGDGRMDIPACVKAADPAVLEWLIVELDFCAGDMMDAVKKSYAYLTGQGLAQGNR